MIDTILNAGTNYNHLKVDSYEAAISTAQDIIDMVHFIKAGLSKKLKTTDVDSVHVKYQYRHDNKEINFYNNNIQSDCLYDPFFRGGYFVFGKKHLHAVKITVHPDDALHLDKEKQIDINQIDLSEETYFQLSTIYDTQVLGLIFVYKYIDLHFNEDIYFDLIPYDCIWNEMKSYQKSS